MLLEFDRWEDFRERLALSELEVWDRKEGVDDEKVLVLELLANIELRFICSV